MLLKMCVLLDGHLTAVGRKTELLCMLAHTVALKVCLSAVSYRFSARELVDQPLII